MRKLFIILAAVAAVLLGPALAAQATEDPECTVTLSGTVPSDPLGSARFIVDDGHEVIVAETGSEVTVGPYDVETTVSYRTFGGGERDFDHPLWNGHGEPGFTADIVDYAETQGGYSWTRSGVSDDNPFTTWKTVVVPGCPEPEPCEWDLDLLATDEECVEPVVEDEDEIVEEEDEAVTEDDEAVTEDDEAVTEDDEAVEVTKTVSGAKTLPETGVAAPLALGALLTLAGGSILGVRLKRS